ncbi:unnamed protein product, partial [Laminaria digitata]
RARKGTLYDAARAARRKLEQQASQRPTQLLPFGSPALVISCLLLQPGRNGIQAVSPATGVVALPFQQRKIKRKAFRFTGKYVFYPR